jgi:RNA polymerase sigma-70 factor, ECF subfamily
LAEDTDKELVKRVQKGDLAAFDMLFAKYQVKVLNLVARYVRDQEEVKDVTQDAFIKAYRALPKFRGDSAFYTWLYRIAINTAKNHLVTRGRRPPSTDVDIDDADYRDDADLLRDVDSPEAALARDQLQDTISRALQALPDDLRTALTLREFDGLSYEQIAQIMACPVGTVRSRIFRAREFVDQQMQNVMQGES